MPFLFFKKKCPIEVTFATACYEKDWEDLLLDQKSLDEMILNHMHPFIKKMLVVNNVNEPNKVLKAAKAKKILTDIVVAKEIEKEILEFFQLNKNDFKTTKDAKNYEGVDDSWIYYNALAPLAAIFSCQTDYLLYTTGDVKVTKPVKWIEKAIEYLNRYPNCKVANLLWNNRKKEAKNQSYKRDRNFFFSKEGFSDQMFLIKTKDFKQPVYQEIRTDAEHFPRGDVFEKRVFSYLKNHGFERIIFRKGFYEHKDTPCRHLTKHP